MTTTMTEHAANAVLAVSRRERTTPTHIMTEALTALEDAAHAAAVAAERALSVADVLDEALAVLAELHMGHGAPPPVRGTERGAATLSPREREVLTLVAEGRTNKAIADALFVSPNTVKTHVASLLSKLHVDSRVQLVAIAGQQELRNAGGSRLRNSAIQITHVEDAILGGDRQTHEVFPPGSRRPRGRAVPRA